MGWYVAFLLLCAINGATLVWSDLTVKDIRYWIIVGCQLGSYAFGRLMEVYK